MWKVYFYDIEFCKKSIFLILNFVKSLIFSYWILWNVQKWHSFLPNFSHRYRPLKLDMVWTFLTTFASSVKRIAMKFEYLARVHKCSIFHFQSNCYFSRDYFRDTFVILYVSNLEIDFLPTSIKIIFIKFCTPISWSIKMNLYECFGL